LGPSSVPNGSTFFAKNKSIIYGVKTYCIWNKIHPSLEGRKSPKSLWKMFFSRLLKGPQIVEHNRLWLKWHTKLYFV
jgi:hypothetical protein